eukprot:SAG31_NODE_2477_length_5637_cov_10.057241_3_plen_169_part_00
MIIDAAFRNLLPGYNYNTSRCAFGALKESFASIDANPCLRSPEKKIAKQKLREQQQQRKAKSKLSVAAAIEKARKSKGAPDAKRTMIQNAMATERDFPSFRDRVNNWSPEQQLKFKNECIADPRMPTEYLRSILSLHSKNRTPDRSTIAIARARLRAASPFHAFVVQR